MFISETYVEVQHKEDAEGNLDDQRIILGESDPYEAYTDNLQKLFLSLQREYGRCTGHEYVGDKEPKKIGWVFEKRQRYQDSKDTYLQETWVTLHESLPEHHTTYHYHNL